MYMIAMTTSAKEYMIIITAAVAAHLKQSIATLKHNNRKIL